MGEEGQTARMERKGRMGETYRKREKREESVQETDAWRESRVRGTRMETECENEQENLEEQPKRKKRRGNYDGGTQWGLSNLTE